MLNKIHQEPCLDTLKRMPSNYLDCVITSPPYWQLRDYGYPEQWGLEPTYNEYLEHLWEMMDEIYRVLKPSGTVWVNLGDTYARGNRTKDGDNHSVSNAKELSIEPKTKPNYYGLNKCLLLLPHRFAIGCIDRGWIIRNDIIWAKRNGMPESITDRFSKKHEYFFFMVKSEKYFFDLDAIRSKHIHGNDKRNDGNRHEYKEGVKSQNNKMLATNAVSFNPLGKNPGSVSDFWDIPTKPSSNEHYAAYNDELLKKPILAGCPVGGIVYDPFMGTGSTAEIALRTDRNYIGSEMSIDYCKIAEQRLLPYKQQQKLF
ncbi:COG0863 DNA modification methylase [uncultured Caudovirales phage]|uniref:site-specific DNA-methyltransferase (cytosine-N(4)-specific) n=1 Tax=uncultured Caudovirales phage TaxID=2100421 RepID=A0A6J5KJG6_9CAUD|nr:COG0863 DNA modification methylase [uncultured Caudovirales phage]